MSDHHPLDAGQKLRLRCLELAVEAGAGPNNALMTAALFENFVRQARQTVVAPLQEGLCGGEASSAA